MSAVGGSGKDSEENGVWDVAVTAATFCLEYKNDGKWNGTITM